MTTQTPSRRAVVKPAKARKPKKTPRTRKPEGMSLEQWQTALRREFGREQKFKLENLGGHPVFSVFRVTNPASGGIYRVTVRGPRPGDSHCTCPDFAINTLGTCKHIEFTLGRLERSAAARRVLERGYSPRYSEILVHYDAERHVRFRPGDSCPAALRRLAAHYFSREGRLRDDAFDRFDDFLKEAHALGHELRCHDDALAFIARVRDRASLRKRLDEAYPDGLTDSVVKKLMKVSLYPYQREGALFAARTGRVLIADDMGLGKTIQAIAAAELLARHGGAERVLIVCPTSLKHQWKQEIEKFTGRTAQVVEGGLHSRAAMFRDGHGAFFRIVNYDVVHTDLDFITAWSPDLIVLDEAQRIKNWKTRTAQAVKRLESPYAIVLTGTPLENRLEELHSIVEFVDRFRLGPAFRFLHAHQHLDENGRVVGYRNLSGIGKTLEPIMVRRTKQQVLKDLPQRLDKKHFVPMTPQQQQYHVENQEIVARVVAKWRRYGFLSDSDQRRLMIALQNMRMSCNSTYLLDPATDHGVKADELMDVLSDVLEDRESKVVIFSQWVRTHELIERRMKHRGWKHVLFHGGVPGPRRKGLVERFKQESSYRCFLSTDAGGVGLNLQNANVVVNMDQPWNPAVLEQRIGRVHRLGQQRPVSVVHFISQGTIEEGMLGLINFKKSLFTGALDGGQDEVFLGGTKLKRFMESVEKATSAATKPMPVQDAETSVEEERKQASSVKLVKGGTQVTQPAAEVWSDIAAAGLSLLDKLAKAVQTSSGSTPGSPGLPALQDLVTRDEKTGESYLKLPMPRPDTIQQIASLLTALTGRQ